MIYSKQYQVRKNKVDKPSKRNEEKWGTYTCSVCSKVYTKLKCLSTGKTKYCSKQCLYGHLKTNRPFTNDRNPNYTYKNNRAYTTIACNRCGCSLERRVDQINQRGTGDFCKPCANILNGERTKGKSVREKRGKLVPCEVCGKEKYIHPYKVAKRRFCSKKCQHVWWAENGDYMKFIEKKLSGSEHPKYKHGKRVGKHVGKPKIRAAVAERDNGDWCLFCGKPGPGLHLHRVIYGSQGGKYEVGNCVQLCGEHHGLVHLSKKTWQPLLLEHLQEPKVIDWLSIIKNDEGIKYKRQMREGA